MSGIFDFIKKQGSNATPAPTRSDSDSGEEQDIAHDIRDRPVVAGQKFKDPNQAQSPNRVQAIGNPVIPPHQEAITDNSTSTSNQSPSTTYNGIGSPAHGSSYNGIGMTPSGGVPYNGIGAPTKPISEKVQQISDADKVQKPSATTNPSQLVKPANDPQSGVAPSSKTPTSLQSTMTGQKRNQLDVMTHLTQRSNKVLLEANNKAKELHNEFADSEHLLHGLMMDGEIYKLLVELKIQPQIVEQELAKIYKKEAVTALPQLAPRVKQIIDNSLVLARKLGYEFISPEHLLLSLFNEGEGAGARVLVKLGLVQADLNKKITGKAEGIALEDQGKEQKQKSKSALSLYTIDLTAKAKAGELDPVVERSDVIERVVHILSRRMKNNPALIGEPGVGKTAVVEGLAQRIVANQVPESLLNKRIVVLDLASVVAGASHRGEFEERMKNVVDELKGGKGEIIMFIDEMHMMMGAGSGEGAIDASNLIKPALARGEVQLIGATTITEYRKYIEKDSALERRFQTVVVPEPTVESAIKMIKASKDKYEAFHKVKIPDDQIELAVKLSKRYIGDRFLPDKAFDLIDEAAAAVRLPLISLPEEIQSIDGRVRQLQQEFTENEKSGEKVKARILKSKIDEVQATLNAKRDEYNMKKAQTTTEISSEIVKDIISQRTGIPISKISATESDKLVSMEDVIHKRMINQVNAVKSVAQAVRRGRAGLKSTNRPIGSFVFLGPTGVGKTELAKTLSEVLFDEEEAVIRFDMTEYMERHEVAKLLGPPPGYVGFEEGGKLTESVRRKPYSLVLFDEVEKAHPDIFNILLQILDDGRLTDNKGRTISFKNTVVICTSNIGTKMIQDELLKSGKTEVSEPTVLSTYVFTPRGREIVTIGNKYFERDSGVANSMKGNLDLNMQNKEASKSEKSNSPTPSSGWGDHKISDYFAGQKLEESPLLQTTTDPTSPQLATEEKASPDQNVKHDQGSGSTTSVKNLSFPSFGYDTHAISPQGLEVITKASTVYLRNATTAKVWQEKNLIDYFKDSIVINAIPDSPDEQLPTIKLKTHAFTNTEDEIVTYKDRYWRRKHGTNDWETGTMKDYFADEKIEKGNFPLTHWDIHTFSPTGEEIIVVGNDVWSKEVGSASWIQKTLSDYFGADFPLDQELESKKQVDTEVDTKKYAIIKEKVMNELLKFFRPELVNRFDEVIVFEPLKFEHMIEIVKLQLKSLSKLLEEQEMGFTATDSAIKEIVRSGFDPIYGARPLRRAIQKLVENPISELILSKKVQAGDTLVVDFDGEEFVFNVEKIERVDNTNKDGPNKSATNTHSEFFCEKCANKFATDILPSSTTICTKCASSQVQKIDKSDPSRSIVDEKNTEKIANDINVDLINYNNNNNSSDQTSKFPNMESKSESPKMESKQSGSMPQMSSI